MFIQQAFKPNFKGYDSNDLHSWVVVSNNKIMDYPIKTLKNSSEWGTNDLKYLAFEEKHQKILYNKYENKLEEKYKLLEKTTISKKELEKIFMVNSGYCFYRSILIHKKLKEMGKDSKVVFGSLGFVQPDGRVFFEYG